MSPCFTWIRTRQKGLFMMSRCVIVLIASRLGVGDL